MKNLYTTNKSMLKCLAVTVSILLFGANVFAQKLGSSFSQYANEPTKEQWIPSALIPNNSQYYEGTSTLQRLVLVNIKPKAGANPNDHELMLKVLATKGGINAYDFITSFDQGLQDYVNITGNQITNGSFDPTNATDRLNLVMGTKIPNPANATMIQTLFTSGNNTRATAASGYGVKQSIVDGYDHNSYPAFSGLVGSAKRGVQLYGESTIGAPLKAITNASLEFNGYSAPDLLGDSYGLYKLKWTSTSEKVMILMAGHLATSNNSSGYSDLWHGPSQGAAFISGGPYHFKLENLDGISLGSQDNQIQSGAIEVFLIQDCSIVPTGPVCSGETTPHTATTDITGADFTWEILNTSTSLATFSGGGTTSGPTTSGTNESSISVVAGGEGYYDLRVTIAKSGFVTKQCSIRVNVIERPYRPYVTVVDASVCGPSTATVTVECPLSVTNGPQYEYRNNEGNWQSSPVFSGIAAGAGYSIEVRRSDAGSDNTCISLPATCTSNGVCPISERQSAPITKPQSSIGKAEVKDLIAYPVPFSESVTVEFKATKAENYVINLYDLQGHLVRELKAGNAKAGEVIKVKVSGAGMSESMYLVRKVSKSGISTVKLLKKD